MPQTPQTEAILAEARFHASLGRAHSEYANGLAALAGEDVDEAPEPRGRVQRRVMGLPRLGWLEGMSAKQIAEALDYDEANTYSAVKSLAAAGELEEVEGASPKRWRLALKHRRNRVLRLSRLVPNARWTTYGDFAIAVYDNVRMAVTVGRVAANNPAFSNPHRLLAAGGVVPDGWHDDEGRGPERCKELLAEEEVWDAGADHADPAARVGWEELKGLLERSEGEEEVPAAA